MTGNNGAVNVAFDTVSENVRVTAVDKSGNGESVVNIERPQIEEQGGSKERPTWGHGMEFLMSCISMSVGLGNIWRFPFTAYENGGGAFLIPYIIILILVGRPLYYMEMILGQFTSRASVKVWEVIPAMKGVALGQLVAVCCIITYYSFLISLTLLYLFRSFASELPWSTCLKSWTEECIDASSLEKAINKSESARSSTDLYFQHEVVKTSDSIADGIGYPDTELMFWLFLAWVALYLVIVKGVKSSGKVAYFTAIFPYVVLLTLLGRAVTLDGALNGIWYFIRPDFGKLLEPKVWYEAVTQMFFSLSMGIGNVIMYSSYNKFDHNIYRDAMIVTTLDTFTSLLAGFTIFGILGNLAYNIGESDMSKVVKSGGGGLAFISYPEAISKFQIFPQLFSVLFFFMLFVLGVGSAVAVLSTVTTNIMDHLPKNKFKYWQVAGVVSVLGFLAGLIYVTPGGQWMLTIVDHFGGTFIIFALAILQITGIIWIYGLDNICWDVEFMLGRKVSTYWRLSWTVITPLVMIIIFIYNMAHLENPTFGKAEFPTEYITAGWIIFAVGISQVIIWFSWIVGYECYENQGANSQFTYNLKKCFYPSDKWGPKNPKQREEWILFKTEAITNKELLIQRENLTKMQQFFYTITGKFSNY